MPRRFATLLAALAGLVVGLFGAEMTFGQLRPQELRSEAVLYSIEVRNAEGELLASPMLVGEEGRPVHLSMITVPPPSGSGGASITVPPPPGSGTLLSGPRSEPLQMSLDLDPQSIGGDNLCVGYRLSIDDGFPHSGRIGVAYGQERSVRLGETLRLSLVVARARSPHFGRLLQRLRRPSA